MEALVSIALFLAATAIAAQFGLRVLIRYLLDDKELRVRFAGLTVVRIPYEQIEDVGFARFWDIVFPRTRATFNGIRAANRLFFHEAVVVRRAGGLRKFVIMTPGDPAEFATELRTRASRGKQASAESRR